MNEQRIGVAKGKEGGTLGKGGKKKKAGGNAE